MALRLIEVRFPADAEEAYRSVLETHAPRENWQEPGIETESWEAGEELYADLALWTVMRLALAALIFSGEF